MDYVAHSPHSLGTFKQADHGWNKPKTARMLKTIVYFYKFRSVIQITSFSIYLYVILAILQHKDFKIANIGKKLIVPLGCLL